MFHLHKEISRLDIPAQRILRLERSLSDVQVAMPGLPAQHATAFLCSFSAGQGTRVAVVLQLHTSGLLAFFLNEEGDVAKSEGTRIYNQGLDFAESMGFMFGDLDIHLKSPEERNTLWASLPLQSGLNTPSTVAPAGAASTNPPQVDAPSTPPRAQKAPEPASHPAAAFPAAKAAKLQSRPNLLATPAPEATPAVGSKPRPEAGKPLSVPAALQAASTNISAPPLIEAPDPLSRPAPSGAELAAKRKELRENLGRFLASF